MRVINWRPAKPRRVAGVILRAGDRAVRAFHPRTGRWPRMGTLETKGCT